MSRQATLCASYPGGPAGYTYQPEKCIRRRDPKRSALQTERAALTAALQQPRNTMQQLASPLAVQVPVTAKALQAALMMVRELQQLPAFLVFAGRHFRKWRARYPDPNTRYDRVCDEWMSFAAPRDRVGAMGDFKFRSRNTRVAVLQLALMGAIR